MVFLEAPVPEQPPPPLSRHRSSSEDQKTLRKDEAGLPHLTPPSYEAPLLSSALHPVRPSELKSTPRRTTEIPSHPRVSPDSENPIPPEPQEAGGPGCCQLHPEEHTEFRPGLPLAGTALAPSGWVGRPLLSPDAYTPWPAAQHLPQGHSSLYLPGYEEKGLWWMLRHLDLGSVAPLTFGLFSLLGAQVTQQGDMS